MKYSIIHHDVRKKFKLTISEYLVCDSIYQLSYGSPCTATAAYLGKFLGLGERTVFRAIANLKVKGVVEERELLLENRTGLIVTPNWVDALTTTSAKMAEKAAKMAVNTAKMAETPIIKTYKDSIIVAEADAPAVVKPKKVDDSHEPMTLKEFLEWCRASEHRHIRLIAEYADERGIKHSTKGQWRQFITRHVRAAKALAPYTDDQIGKAIKLLLKDTKEQGGFMTKWTLETVVKYID